MAIKVTLENGLELVIENKDLEQTITKQIEKEMGKQGNKNFVVEEKMGDGYWYIDYDGEIMSSESTDLESLEDYNAFTNKEYAEKVHFKQLFERKLLKFKEDNDKENRGWDRTEINYVIEFNAGVKDLSVEGYNTTFSQGNIPFSSKEVCEKAIEVFHDDLIKYFNLGL